jgi:hypothetical protein
MKEIFLLLHPALGVLSVIAAVWVIAETINASTTNLKRIQTAALISAVLMFLTWITSGYLYVLYYAAEKAIILNGPWSFAHTIIMESKEHLFFMTLVLSFLLPIATRMNNIIESKQARILIITIAGLIVLSGLALEGAGAMISLGVKMGLLQGIAQ